MGPVVQVLNARRMIIHPRLQVEAGFLFLWKAGIQGGESSFNEKPPK
jgi:hypothetical protein